MKKSKSLDPPVHEAIWASIFNDLINIFFSHLNFLIKSKDF